MASYNAQLVFSKVRIALGQLRFMPRTMRLVWEASGRHTVLLVSLLLTQGLLPVISVYLTKKVVDGIAALLGTGWEWSRVAPVARVGALLGAVVLAGEVLRAIIGWVRRAQADLVRDHISGLIHKQSVKADLGFYDSPEFFDHLYRARSEAAYRPVTLLENLGSLLQNTVTLVAMLLVLVQYGVWLPLALIASTLPAFVIVLRHNLRQHHWRLRATREERRAMYYDWVMTDGGSAAEMRLFGLGEYFWQAFQDIRQRLRSGHLRLIRDQSVAEMLAAVLALAILGGAILLMVWRAIGGQTTLGDLALFYQAINHGQRLMRSLLDNVGQIYTNTLFLSNLFEYLDLKPSVCSPAKPIVAPVMLERGIAFRDVSFRYAGCSADAVSRLNLWIPANSVAAIVGRNGAGKSTLIKLLCRFYDPDEGAVEFDGVDLRRFDLAALRNMISVLFQEPVHYNQTVAENISFGHLGAGSDRVRIRRAAAAAGADEVIERLPHAYENLLGRWFEEGAELSVGEWQRIALARAFLRESPIILLDEPTSAMDPWAEADWLARFRELARGRTALLITHRFTTAMYADVIHVMGEGRITESGSHAELMRKGSAYAQCWESQGLAGQFAG